MSDTAENKESVVAAVVEEVRAPQTAESLAEASAQPETEASGRGKKTREQMNLENLKNVGAMHGAAVIAALTLFGAAHTWAAVSGWMLAAATAVSTAVLAGIVISSIAHEWGHFSGTVLSGSRYKVARKPYNYFFMFSFDMAANSSRQAIWMSWGGLAGSWFILAAVISLVPMDSWASAALAATVLGQAVNASVFEVPIILRTRASGEFEKELERRLENPGVVRMPGLIVGLLAFALLT